MNERVPAPMGAPSWARGCLLLVTVAVVLMLVVSVLTRSGPGEGGMSGGGARVGLIRVEGVIENARPFLDELRRLESDRRVRALVVRIHSPGGGVAPTQQMMDGLRRFRARTGYPVIGCFVELAASGGYYLACAAEEIVCEPGTLTGSIGVILSFVDASALLARVGVKMEVVKSGPRKDFGSWWRPLAGEERAMLDDVVADAYDQFTSAVVEARGLDPAVVRELADGRILTGRQALAAGLVDTLGFEPDAIQLAARRAGLAPQEQAISKERREPEWLDLLRRLSEGVRMATRSGTRLEYR